MFGVTNRKGETDMTTSTFAPFKEIEVTCDVDWDIDDVESGSATPLNIYSVKFSAENLFDNGIMKVNEENGEYEIDEDSLVDSDLLSDELTEDAWYCHRGYRLVRLEPCA